MTREVPDHRSARDLGYRLPAEFEPVSAVWVAEPHNQETWPGCLDRARAQHALFVTELEKRIRVELIGRDHDWAVNDAWVRDYGPIFVVRKSDGGEAKIACHDFVFNGWGDKYGDEYEIDDQVPRAIAELREIPVFLHSLVLEGGSIEANGLGTLLTTEQCLLHPNRNPGVDRAGIETRLREAFAVDNVVWLPGGIVGDDTDGHIDDIARFVTERTIAALRAPKHHPDHEVLEANWKVLERARDQDGRPFDLVPLPVPEPIHYPYPADRFGPAETRPLPASYANFLMVNESIYLPVFGQSNDDMAARILERAADKEIVPIRSDALVVGLGAVHCLSMQEPERRVDPTS